MLEAFIAAGAGVVAEDSAFVEQFDAVVVFDFGLSGGETADFADCYVSVGDCVGGEVKRVGCTAVLEDEDVWDI